MNKKEKELKEARRLQRNLAVQARYDELHKKADEELQRILNFRWGIVPEMSMEHAENQFQRLNLEKSVKSLKSFTESWWARWKAHYKHQLENGELPPLELYYGK